jgi:ferric-dicitrate binding protein FerR (iron transport regulator)
VATWTAAAVAIVLVAGITLTQRHAASVPSPIRTYVTSAGEQATIALDDGSRIRLAPSSRLSIDPGYGTQSRTVRLTGEAYFEVRSAGAAPFVVHTGRVSTRVLGTAFDVRRYPEDTSVRVAVVSGKVASGGLRAPVTLTAGTVGFITDSTALVADGDATTYNSWTQGRLVFEDVSVPTMLATVGRWYGYHFRLSDSTLATQHVTAVFKISDPAQMMTTLRELLDVTMTFDSTVITLHPRSSATRATPRSRGRDTSLLPFTEVGR